MHGRRAAAAVHGPGPTGVSPAPQQRYSECT
jgi:hypothetical protein